jgi:uncharacterized protein (TIGR00266 family)
MQVDLQHRPAFAVATVKLGPQENIQVEAGAMVAMSSGITLETKARGGVLASLKRSVLGGESFFINNYRAPAGGGEIMLAPALPGDVFAYQLQGETLMVQSGSYLASSEEINIDTKWGGAKTFFSREGLFMLKCSGTGMLILSSYGAIHQLELGPGQSYTVDTGHLVAFSESMGFKIRAIGGLKSTLFSGEGLVVDLGGPGQVFLQTRSEDAFLGWLIPKLPKPSSGS